MVEQYFSKKYNDCKTDRIYLPIYWTNYYCQQDYGNGNINPLFRWLDELDKSEKYFTVIQFDDGIIDLPEGLDLLVFSSGHPIGTPIPLLPSHYLAAPKTTKGYDLTFIGSLDTHPLRKAVVEETGCWRLNGLLPHDYYKSLAQSEFTLCTRGYGVTSFRLYEALYCGAVPIYVSDIHWLPYQDVIDWNKLLILVRPNEIHQIRYKMSIHKQDWSYYEKVKHMFTMEGILNYIKNHLENE